MSGEPSYTDVPDELHRHMEAARAAARAGSGQEARAILERFWRDWRAGGDLIEELKGRCYAYAQAPEGSDDEAFALDQVIDCETRMRAARVRTEAELDHLRGLLENLMGAFDAPIARRRIGDEFAAEARAQARVYLDSLAGRGRGG